VIRSRGQRRLHNNRRLEFREQFLRTFPAGRATLYEAKIEELRTNFTLEAAAGVGTKPAPPALPASMTAAGGRVHSCFLEFFRGAHPQPEHAPDPRQRCGGFSGVLRG
jgi:hypothetical protein